MRTLIYLLLAVVVLAVAAVLVAPSFIDWNARKPWIAAEIKKRTGRDLTIEGDVALQLLPRPALAVEGLSLANVEGGSAPDLLRLAALEMEVAPWALLRGVLELRAMTLVEPRLLLEILPDGRANWRAVAQPRSEAGGAAAAPGAAVDDDGMDVVLGSLEVRGGEILYRDATRNREERVEAIDASIRADSLRGPLSIDGQARRLGRTLRFELATGRLGSAPALLRARLALPDAGDARLRFSGSMTGTDPLTGLRGELDLEGEDLAALVDALAPGAALPPELAAGFSGKTDVAFDGERVALQDMALRFGATTASGEADLLLDPEPDGRLVLSVHRLDLDELLAGGGQGGQGGGGDTPGALFAGGFRLPAELTATVQLDVDAIVYRRQVVRQTLLTLALVDGRVLVEQALALLPGGADLSLSGMLQAEQGEPRFTGRVEAAADNLRVLLRWLGIEPAGVASDHLRRAALTGRIDATPRQATLADLDLEVDVTRVTGGVAVALRQRPGLGIGLAVDRLDLDAYRVAPAPAAVAPSGTTPAGERPDPRPGSSGAAVGDGTESRQPTAPAAAAAPRRLPLPLPLDAFDANLDLRVGELRYNGQPLRDLQLDGTLQNGALTLRRLSFADIATARGALSGVVAGLPLSPRLSDGRFDVAVQAPSRLARLLALPPEHALHRLTAFAAQGTAEGSREHLSYDLQVTGLGGRLDSAATLRGLDGAHDGALAVEDGRLELQGIAGDALAALAGRPAGPLARVGPISGRIDLSGDLASLEGRADLALLDGRLAASGRLQDLAAAAQILDGRLAASGLDLAPLTLFGELPGRLGRLDLDSRFAGSLQAMTYETELRVPGGGLGFAGSVRDLDSGFPEVDSEVTLRHDDLAALLGAIDPTLAGAGGSGPVALTGRLSGSPLRFALAGLEGRAGASQIDGDVEVSLTDRLPVITARLALDRLSLAGLGGGNGGGDGGGDGGGGGGDAEIDPRWSPVAYDSGLLTAANGDLDLAVAELDGGGWRFDQARARLRLADGLLSLEDLAAGFGGGRLAASGTLDAGRADGVLAAALALELSDVRAGQLLRRLSDELPLDGPLSLQASLTSSGRREAELVSRLEGAGDVAGSLQVEPGLRRDLQELLPGDLGDRVGAIAGVGNALGLLTSGFVDAPARLTGSLQVRDGVVRTDDARLQGQDAEVRLQGVLADLPRWRIGLDARLYRGGGSEPELTVGLRGPLDQPNPRVGWQRGQAPPREPGQPRRRGGSSPIDDLLRGLRE